ncbi:polyunsaturated fatty acid 5-lipoxygenase-like [Scyliorhinus canicula]|uniref:polyunsaturated fatty acid 5-lipoxygenase-like n=1 Tax=Scyliorhinus canicula TaxID=7830 RepID=UPI0018F58DF3|nr:polyunsaturated fatty acid 5-lipoxygenase-like [Scyliorhinus canicula]
MVIYMVTVSTGEIEYAGTDSYVYCTLIGERGESQRINLDKYLQRDFYQGDVKQYDVSSDQDLGNIRFVKLEVTKFLVEDYWLCLSVLVETPLGETLRFPCYKWLSTCTILLREGTAKRLCDDKLAVFLTHRRAELEEKLKVIRWKVFAPNFPRCIDADTEEELPMDLRFSNEKSKDFSSSRILVFIDLFVKKFTCMFQDSWTSTEDFNQIFQGVESQVAVFAKDHWKEDWFFGYQFLNGCNPVLVRKCEKIPKNFPVTDTMVQASLGKSKLQQEIKNGNIFIADYKMLDGIVANVIKGVQQYLAAPICLLYLDKQNRLMPIAIQVLLGQVCARLEQRKPLVMQDLIISEKKREAVKAFHLALIRTLACDIYVFVISFELLIPHTRFTLEINTRGRNQLMPENGAMNRALGIGVQGHISLSQEEFLAITYRSLCLQESLEDRGLGDLKGYYYKEDGLQIWSAIHKFVIKVVSFYYERDQEVMDDPELQAWITDLTEVGFQDLKNSGMPTSFRTRAELCKFLTMVIFTCSAQHAAMNNGQYDWNSWVPNAPCSMRKPPPTSKGTMTMKDIIESLPGITQSCVQMAITWHLSRTQPQVRRLGDYHEEHFTEAAVKAIIQEFREELAGIDRSIQVRNEGLDQKYEYLRPVNIENSITI